MKKMTPEELEKYIHETLRSLPMRSAPGTLEARVLAALEHRATIPWYHQSWSYWPAAVRAVFLGLATGLAGTCMAAFYLGFQGVETSALFAEVGQRLGLVAKLFQVVPWVVDFVASLVNRVPSLWLYGGIALIGSLYATFFGLGAAAYRALYRNN